jgi:phosphinothricin acetyltransferase
MTAIRLARAADAGPIGAIYAPFVTGTATSFEVVVPTETEIAARIEGTVAHAPWLVAVEGEDVLGFAYASKHRERAAYRWSVDVSVYVHGRARRRGMARGLYTSLFALLRRQGFYAAHAGITLPNPASVGVHEAMGFRPVGVYRKVGFKLGAWHDVGWWQLELRDRPDTGTEPPTPRSMADAQADPDWAAALGAGLPLLRP